MKTNTQNSTENARMNSAQIVSIMLARFNLYKLSVSPMPLHLLSNYFI